MILLPDNSKRAKNLLVCFYVLAIINILVLVSYILQYFLLKKMQVGNYVIDEATANDFRHNIIIITHIVMFIICAVFFILWFRRAYNNLNLSERVYTKYPEGWAAGAWFVPFLNLGRPYVIMKEIWTKTQEETTGLLNFHNSAIVGWWWTFWIISNILTNITSKMFDETNLEELCNGTIAQFICDSFEFVALILIIIIVKKVKVFEENFQNSLLSENKLESEDKLDFILN